MKIVDFLPFIGLAISVIVRSGVCLLAMDAQ